VTEMLCVALCCLWQVNGSNFSYRLRVFLSLYFTLWGGGGVVVFGIIIIIIIIIISFLSLPSYLYTFMFV